MGESHTSPVKATECDRDLDWTLIGKPNRMIIFE